MRIFFRIERDEDGWPPVDVESMWGERVEDGYRIDNIPFYAPLLAYGDVVTAGVENGRLEFTGMVRASGHGTVRIIAHEESTVPVIQQELVALGCACEPGPLRGFLAVDIPPMASYRKITDLLRAGLHAERFEYEEACAWW